MSKHVSSQALSILLVAAIAVTGVSWPVPVLAGPGASARDINQALGAPADQGTVGIPTNGQVLTYSTTTNSWRAGAAGGGGVTSVSGTANQITVTGTTTPTLSLPAAITLPGTLTAGGTLTMGANTLALASATVSGTPTWSSSQAITLSTAAQGNVTSLGTLTGLTMGGTLTMGANTLALASATVSGTPTWSSNQAITLSTAAQGNVTSLGTLTSLTMGGTLTMGANTLALASATVSGQPTWSSSQAITLSTAAQTAITSVGTLAGLTMTGTLSMSGTPVISGSPASTLGATTVTTLGTGGNVTLAAGNHLVLSTSGAGTQIGTGTTQLLGFYGATAVAQISGSTDVLAGLVTHGLRAASSNPPLNLGTGILQCGIAGVGSTTQTANNPVLEVDQTWNNAGVSTFQGIVGRWNVTNGSGNIVELFAGTSGLTQEFAVSNQGIVTLAGGSGRLLVTTSGGVVQVATNGNFLFNGRGGLASSADGALSLINTAATGYTSLTYGANRTGSDTASTSNTAIIVGAGTGIGAPPTYRVQTPFMASVSGSTVQVQADRDVIGNEKTLSTVSATATTYAIVTLPTGSSCGGEAWVCVEAADNVNGANDNRDMACARIQFGGTNKNGAVTLGTSQVSTETSQGSSGSTTATPTAVASGATILLKVTPTFTTIVPTTSNVRVRWRVFLNGPGVVAAQ